MNTAKKEARSEKQDSKKQVERDLAFEEKLGQHPKNVLTMALAQMTSDSSTREWILNYLEEMDGLMDAARMNGPKLREGIFRAIDSERRTQDEMHGPVQMNPRTLPEWIDRLQRLIIKASSRANTGQDLPAMKLILLIARDSVACLEDRIDSVDEHHKDSLADAIGKVMKHPAENIDVLLEMGSDKNKDVELTTLRQIGRNGVAYRGHYYWGSWMANHQGEKVKLKFPSEPRSVIVIDAETEQRIGEAYRMQPVHVDNGTPFDENKPADPDGSGPAGKAESTNEG